MTIPSTRINRQFGGYRCPVSNIEFMASNSSKAELQRVYAEQQQHTNAIIFELEQIHGRLTLEECKKLWEQK